MARLAGACAALQAARPVGTDAWPKSFWVETSVMVALAGYVLQELLDGYSASPPREKTDYQWVMALLKTVEPDPERTVAEFHRLRGRVGAFLLQPWLLGEIFDLASLLAKDETLSGKDLHARLYEGRCAAACPTNPSLRCDNPRPHARGTHMSITRRDAPTEWSGFALRQGRAPAVSTLTGALKALTNLDHGGPHRLAERWLALIDSVDEFPLHVSGESLPTAWCQ